MRDKKLGVGGEPKYNGITPTTIKLKYGDEIPIVAGDGGGGSDLNNEFTNEKQDSFSISFDELEPLVYTRRYATLKPIKDPNVNNVIELIKARSKKGLEEYGTDTTRDDYNALDWLNEAQCEMLDGGIYLEVIKQKYIKFQELIKNTPNDKELGEKIRRIYK